jgi:uncharacterized cupin superfamily protein
LANDSRPFYYVFAAASSGRADMDNRAVDVVNLFEDDWDNRRDRPGWQWNHMSVGERVGAELIGASVYEIEPGQKTFPYHWQYVEEELLIVLDGEPTLRTPEGERRLTRGDAVVFRRGPEGAHLVRNDTVDPVRILMLSTPSQLEIAEYPDSDKIGVFAKGLRLLVRRESSVDYFDGEE